ncbi:MAG: hypothetical protein A3J75_05575 [Acidobacteria bacterium RBG_16_68_9]|nr:MAG: hypothetical protein A3J75_05575 [Acidobacteria bacterium RBG_16_68_9]
MPVVYEDRQVLAGGRYLQEIRISGFPPSSQYPEGLRYSLCLIDQETGEVVLLYDIHRGKGHHRHVRGKEKPYLYRDPATLVADFQRDVDLVIGGQL